MLYLGTLVQDGLAHMRGVTWQAVPAKFKTGMCEMKKFGSEVCSVSWDVGSGWVGSHAWCNMESCSGKVQKRDVWDENLRVWDFVVCLQDGLAHMRGVIWRAAPAKFKRGMCEMKILGSEVLWCVIATLVQGWHMRGVICSELFRQSSGMCEMNIFGLKFVVCLGTLVQDGLAHMRGVIWRAAPAKFKTGMCEMKILGSEVLCCVFATLVQGWHTCEVQSVRQSSKQGCVRWKFSDWNLYCVLGRWFRMGWLTCVVYYGELFRQSSKQGCVR